MTPPRQPAVSGVVFRRLRSPSERVAAGRLLADGDASGSPVEGGDVLFGLWDLAGLDVEALLAAAATRPVDASGSVELRGIAVRARLRRRGLGRRLLAEVADALRTEGAARLVARLTGGQGPAAALLARAGFVSTADGDGESAGDHGWHYLEL